MAKHEALPDYVYQRELADSSTYVRQDQSTSEEKASATVERTSMEQEEDDDEIEYDESTDEEGRALKNLMTKMTLGTSCQLRLTRVRLFSWEGQLDTRGLSDLIPVFCSNKVRSKIFISSNSSNSRKT